MCSKITLPKLQTYFLEANEFKFKEILVYPLSTPSNQISINICICHDNVAVIWCVKFCNHTFNNTLDESIYSDMGPST